VLVEPVGIDQAQAVILGVVNDCADEIVTLRHTHFYFSDGALCEAVFVNCPA